MGPGYSQDPLRNVGDGSAESCPRFSPVPSPFFSAYGISCVGLECRCNRVCHLSGAKDLCRPKKSEMQRFFAALRMTPLPIATVKMP